MLLIVLVFASVVSSSILPVYAQGEYVAFPETVSISSPDLVPHNFILKAISKPNGDVEKVSGFKLDPVNVISVLASDTISATSTDEVIVFEQAKGKSSTDSLFELQKTTATQGQQQTGFSLAGLAPGVYTLDIIAAKNNAKAAYEGIIVIGQNPESQEVRQVVEREIIEVERDTPTTIIPVFQPPSNPQPPPGPPIILQQQQQQQPAAIPLGGQAPVNPATQQPLAAQRPPTTPAPSPTLGAPGGTSPGSTDRVPLCTTPNGQPGRLSSKEGGGVTCVPIGGGTTPPQAPSPSPQPQALAAQPAQCQSGFEGIPPQCTPIQPGSEPTDLLSLDPSSLDPNDPLFGEPGVLGEETGEGENAENLDIDEGDSESDSESNEEGGGNEERGDSGDNDSGDGGDSGSGDGGGDGRE